MPINADTAADPSTPNQQNNLKHSLVRVPCAVRRPPSPVPCKLPGPCENKADSVTDDWSYALNPASTAPRIREMCTGQQGMAMKQHADPAPNLPIHMGPRMSGGCRCVTTNIGFRM